MFARDKGSLSPPIVYVAVRLKAECTLHATLTYLPGTPHVLRGKRWTKLFLHSENV